MLGVSEKDQPIFIGDFEKLITFASIDLLAILQKSLDRAIFLYNFIREVR